MRAGRHAQQRARSSGGRVARGSPVAGCWLQAARCWLRLEQAVGRAAGLSGSRCQLLPALFNATRQPDKHGQRRAQRRPASNKSPGGYSNTARRPNQAGRPTATTAATTSGQQRRSGVRGRAGPSSLGRWPNSGRASRRARFIARAPLRVRAATMGAVAATKRPQRRDNMTTTWCKPIGLGASAAVAGCQPRAASRELPAAADRQPADNDAPAGLTWQPRAGATIRDQSCIGV